MSSGREDRGQATVEFALILPLLVVLIAGVLWVGQLVTTQVRLEHAVREGARAAVIEPNAASANARAAVIRSMPDVESVTAVVGPEYVVVTVVETFAGLPFVGVGARELVAEAHMRREDIIE